MKVTPVADTPSVTNATTSEDTQSTSGLVVSRNAADGSIDYSALDALVDRQLAGGTHALVVAGSTGEAAMPTDEEYSALVAGVVARRMGVARRGAEGCRGVTHGVVGSGRPPRRHHTQPQARTRRCGGAWHA